MDIEEYKKLARSKIEADALTRQVRDVIKITKWQKQDVREGFKETFKPLIKSQDSIKKSIDEQQNATIAQLKKNQLALTQSFEQFNRLADMRELPYPDEEGWDRNWGAYGKAGIRNPEPEPETEPEPEPEPEPKRRFCLKSVTNNYCSIKTFHPHIIFIYCYYIFYCRIFCVRRKIFLREFHIRVSVATLDHD